MVDEIMTIYVRQVQQLRQQKDRSVETASVEMEFAVVMDL